MGICSEGFTMIDLSLDPSMDSFADYFESWNVFTLQGRTRPYLDDSVLFSDLWLPGDEFTKYRIASQCISCIFTGVRLEDAAEMKKYCNCYQPLQSPTIFMVASSELPEVTSAGRFTDDLYIDHLIKFKPGRNKVRKEGNLNVRGSPDEMQLDKDLKSAPRIKIHGIFRANWIAAIFWSIMVILCVLAAALGYTKCQPSETTSSEAEAESSVLPGS